MRRHPSRFLGASSLLFGTLAAVVMSVGVVGPTAAFAEDPTPTPGAEEPTGSGADRLIGPADPGEEVCTVDKSQLDAVSGMVVTQQGIYAVESGDTNQIALWTIDAASCVATTKNYDFNPIDPQDLALASDGSLVVADIGWETPASRTRIALEKLTVGDTKVTPYRLVYAGGATLHALAMLLTKDDQPIIIAQEGGVAGVYQPSTPIVPDVSSNLPELTKVGDFTPQETGTENPMSAIGNSLVTGAAKSPDGTKVVIRTVSDAYEFEIGEDGDIAKAIVEGTPSVTRLPNEPGGGAIAYSADGESFLTLAPKAAGATENAKLLSYTRYIPPPEEPAGGETPTQPQADERGWLERLSFSELTRIVSAVGVVGLVLAIAGIVGIRRARRRRREEEEYDDYDDYDDDRRGRGRGRRGGRGGRDDYGYGDYDQGYADAGYGGNGYAAGGYAEAGYGGRSGAGYANGYGGNGYPQQQYGADQYGGQQQYGGQAGYDPYGQPQYGADQYGAEQYGGQQYGGEPHSGGQQYGGQQYGGGYGYEEDFDPMHDPRRR
jgi:hypothetical protein